MSADLPCFRVESFNGGRARKTAGALANDFDCLAGDFASVTTGAVTGSVRR